MWENPQFEDDNFPFDALKISPALGSQRLADLETTKLKFKHDSLTVEYTLIT